MKNKILSVVLGMVLGIIAIAIIVLVIYTLIKYGGEPISEVPTWAFWIMNRR